MVATYFLSWGFGAEATWTDVKKSTNAYTIAGYTKNSMQKQEQF